MKYTEIDGYKIIAGESIKQIDPVKTKKRIKELGEKINPENIQKYAVYFQTKNTVEVSESLKAQYENLEPDQKLSISGEIIPDHRNKTDFKKVDGKWTQIKIDKLGITPEKPKLSEAEQKEYSDQLEAERIEKLTPEERTANQENEINALAQDAVLKKQVATLRGKTFDEVKYFNEKQVDINKKYEVKK